MAMKKKYVADNKKQRIEDAKAWFDKLNNTPAYVESIEEAKKKIVYVKEPKINADIEPRYAETKVSVFNNDVAICTRAAINHASKDDRICVLDFASYSNPGGGFLKGSLSQEESICRMSGLYPILLTQQAVYDERRKDRDKSSIYGKDYFYCPDVPFIINERGKIYKADVMVMAAPNRKACDEFTRIPSDVIDCELEERMELIYTVPATYGCTGLLLGAFGCGVFGNDTEMVAKHWNYFATKKYKGLYKFVTHPVFDNEQSRIFKKICL